MRDYESQTQYTKRITFAFIAATAVACGSERGEMGISPREAEDIAITEHLVNAGFDLSAVQFEGDLIRIEGDATLPRDSILLEIESQPFTPASQYRENAYWYASLSRLGEPVEVPPVHGIGFQFTAAVPTPWREAFRHAAAEWSKSTCIRFTERAGGITTVDIGEAGTASDGTPASASASFPFRDKARGFTIGRRVTIDHSVVSSTDTTFNRSLMLHEIGHLFGFKHPRQGYHLAGTSQSSTGCDTGGCVASYPTVMDYTMTEQTLTADDMNAANRAYKKVLIPRNPTPQCR